MRRSSVPGVIAVVGYLGLLFVAGWNNRYAANPDAIAYIRIASYFARGESDLMVSGYWGPLLSWLIAPFLSMVSNPLFAARIAMGVSAVVFVVGAFELLRLFELLPAARRLAIGVVALASLAWSSRGITPDLLVAGLMCLGASFLLARTWHESRRKQLAAGLCFGAAYLAKAVAGPTFGVMSLLVVAVTLRRRQATLPKTLQSLALTWLSAALLAGPWIATLSVKYGRPVFSTTARIAHTLSGPDDVDRFHPVVRTFSMPEPGRITSWEDPTDMDYRHWSPFQSATYLRHQLGLMMRQTVGVIVNLSSFDLLRLGLVPVLVSAVLWRCRDPDADGERSLLVVIALVAICLPYIPIYTGPARYYYAALPLLLAAAFRLAVVRPATGHRCGLTIRAAAALVILSFVASHAYAAARSCVRISSWVEPSWLVLARKLQTHEIDGPIASSTFSGFYIALLIDEPLLGAVKQATIDQFRASDAGLVIVARRSAVAEDLAADTTCFESLDPVLFPSEDAAGAFALKAYRKVRSDCR